MAKRAVAAYEKDQDGHWVAVLICGHCQHFRHDPPWQNREWVLTEVGRCEKIGTLVECKVCDS